MRVATVAVWILVAALAYACEESEPLPSLGALPPLELTDQTGAPFGLDDMRGRVWIASFVFTKCPTICPTLSSKMAELSRRFAGREAELGLVSFTVDPENDTPEVLREYSARFDANPAQWKWVTGRTEHVSDVVVRGFRLGLGEPVPTGDGEGYEIMHSSHFVLVDASGEIRGYYASDAEGIPELVDDATRLIEEAR